MMYLLHNIGEKINSNYNTKEEVSSHDNLTFDGVYRNVWENRELLKNKNVILFIMGDYVGKDNLFDTGMPLEKLCSWEELNDLVSIGCKLGWHTWSHRDLTTLDKEEIMRELKCPFETKYFAYPYGRFNDLVVECVKESGYEFAYSVTQGNDNPLTLKREYLCLSQ